MNKFNWDIELAHLYTDDAVTVFYDLLPGIKISTDYPLWYSNYTKSLLKEKYKLHKRWKRFKNILDYQEFSNIRRQVKASIKNDYNNYISKVERDMGDNIKCFWSYVSNKSRSKNIPKFIQSGNEIASGDIDVCKSFSRYFASVFEPSDTPSLIKSRETFATITLNFVKIEQIKNQIDKLDKIKRAGPDGIPPVFFKSCKDSTYIRYLLYIINQYLRGLSLQFGNELK